jgi:hypothetical protein
MAFLRINRFGEVATHFEAHNQCKDVGHTRYRYHVAVKCCETNLDKNDFIIDHALLHETVIKVFERHISSCEGLIVEIKDKILKLCKRHKLQVVDLYIKLQPIVQSVGENYAFMEFSMNGDFP